MDCRQDLINELFRTNANVTRIEYLFRLCMSDVELLKVAVESSRWKATMTAVRASVEGVQTRLKDAQKRLNDLMWSSREASGGIQHTLTDFVCIVAPCLNDPSITRDCKFKELGFCIEKMEEHEAVALGVANEFYELCEHISATMEDCMSLPEQICAVVKDKHRENVKKYSKQLKYHLQDVLGALIETFTGGSVDEIDIITTLTIPALSLFFRTAKCSFEFWKIHREAQKLKQGSPDGRTKKASIQLCRELRTVPDLWIELMREVQHIMTFFIRVQHSYTPNRQPNPPSLCDDPGMAGLDQLIRGLRHQQVVVA